MQEFKISKYFLYTMETITGGNIASSWAALRSMGEDGYMHIAKQLMDTANKMKSIIRKIKVS